MDEFEFIKSKLAHLAGPEALSLLDDAAIYTPQNGQDLVITMDTMVEGVHFVHGQFDAPLAQKLIRVNISDLAAKGAKPMGYLLSLSIPEDISLSALSAFCEGLAIDQAKYGIALWGGDTTKTPGPASLSLTAIGHVPSGAMVKRNGAKTGDILCATGTIGDGYLGLKTALNQLDVPNVESQYLLDRYVLPNPPMAARALIRQFATAAADVSDGLVADINHIVNASKVGAIIEIDSVPISSAASLWIGSHENAELARAELITGGDDYQVVLTMGPKLWEQAYRSFASVGVELTKIGRITDGSGCRVINGSGDVIPLLKKGYTHF